MLSLGWGVQSWTIVAMSALGKLPKLDVAIHSDTSWEHTATYAFAKQWTPWLEAQGIKVVTVGERRQAQKVLSGKTDIPAFTINYDRGGSKGQLRRQCTDRWKIKPIRRFIRAIQKGCVTMPLETRFGLAWRYRVPLSDFLRVSQAITPFSRVQQWLGISWDEFSRARTSDVKYIDNHYPLLELRMTRGDCITWLERQGLPIPLKSSCVFCPYHSLTAWQVLKRGGGLDWQTALEVDASIRECRPPYPLFVHPARIPLEQAVKIPEDDGFTQLEMFDKEMTSCDGGHCFV
ncbi:MAG: hypothetical protein GY934_20480 [Gammaproteobacteria bacterium]|nr:hypothetical protein [Gammaproteobacteria bacterium]